jgi:hypothetical protein
MKRFSLFLAIVAVAAILFAGCERDNSKGTINLAITDAPIDSEDIVGVYITVTDVQYHISGNNFESFPDFEGPKFYNLLDLTRGESEMLGTLELEAGQYTQIRFILDAPERGMATPANPGCYLEFGDGTTQALFVPSGSQTGFKGVGAFTVPSNGSVDITADFDVRKSVVVAGMSGMYILKPTIRLVVNNEAGKIVGGVTNIPENTEILVFAYEDGVYTEAEAADPAAESPRFPNAVSSDMVDEGGAYHIDFLAPMTYDLVVVANVDGAFSAVLGIIDDVIVESKKTTTQSIDINSL